MENKAIIPYIFAFVHGKEEKMFDEMQFLELFGTDAFISVNKHLIKEIGLVEAVLFGELLSKYKYYKAQGQLVDNKWFYATVATIEDAIGIKKDSQATAIKSLQRKDLIEVKQMGLPAKRHFAVNVEKLMTIYLKKASQSASLSDSGNSSNKEEEIQTTRKRKNSQLDNGNSSTIKISNKNKDIKTTNKNIKSLVTNNDIIDFCNSLYTKYSVGRWTKRQWNTLIKKFVEETNWNEVKHFKAYCIEAIETMAFKHDYKNGLIEVKENNATGAVPFYNWLEQ